MIIRRRDLKTIKSTLGWVTCSVNWRQDNSCKSSWCRLNLKLPRIWTTDCSSWVLIDLHQLRLCTCFFFLPAPRICHIFLINCFFQLGEKKKSEWWYQEEIFYLGQNYTSKRVFLQVAQKIFYFIDLISR